MNERFCLECGADLSERPKGIIYCGSRCKAKYRANYNNSNRKKYNMRGVLCKAKINRKAKIEENKAPARSTYNGMPVAILINEGRRAFDEEFNEKLAKGVNQVEEDRKTLEKLGDVK